MSCMYLQRPWSHKCREGHTSAVFAGSTANRHMHTCTHSLPNTPGTEENESVYTAAKQHSQQAYALRTHTTSLTMQSTENIMRVCTVVTSSTADRHTSRIPHSIPGHTRHVCAEPPGGGRAATDGGHLWKEGGRGSTGAANSARPVGTNNLGATPRQGHGGRPL